MNPEKVQDFQKFIRTLEKAIGRLLTIVEEFIRIWKKTFLNDAYAKILFKKGYMLHFYYLRYMHNICNLCDGCMDTFCCILKLSNEIKKKKSLDAVDVIRFTVEVRNISNSLREFSVYSETVKDDALSFYLDIMAEDLKESLDFKSCVVMAFLTMCAVHIGWEGPLVLGAVYKYCRSYQETRNQCYLRDSVKELHGGVTILVQNTYKIAMLIQTSKHTSALSLFTDNDLDSGTFLEKQAAYAARTSKKTLTRLKSIHRDVHRSQEVTFAFIRRHNSGVVIIPK